MKQDCVDSVTIVCATVTSYRYQGRMCGNMAVGAMVGFLSIGQSTCTRVPKLTILISYLGHYHLKERLWMQNPDASHNFKHWVGVAHTVSVILGTK